MQTEQRPKPLVVLSEPLRHRRGRVHELAVDLVLLAEELRVELVLLALVLGILGLVVWTWPS